MVIITVIRINNMINKYDINIKNNNHRILLIIITILIAAAVIVVLICKQYTIILFV